MMIMLQSLPTLSGNIAIDIGLAVVAVLGALELGIKLGHHWQHVADRKQSVRKGSSLLEAKRAKMIHLREAFMLAREQTRILQLEATTKAGRTDHVVNRFQELMRDAQGTKVQPKREDEDTQVPPALRPH